MFMPASLFYKPKAQELFLYSLFEINKNLAGVVFGLFIYYTHKKNSALSEKSQENVNI